MTQAFNLSQFANKVNTSGQADLTTAVSGTLPVANGGTGVATLTANNVILGNGTSAVQVVAPSTSGNVLTSNGSTWTSAAAPVSTGALIGYTVYTTVGANTYTKATNNPSFIIVELLGGGGGGNGGPQNNTGASGKGGAYCRKKILASALAASETVTVGAGGTAGSSAPGPGGAGGTTSFGAFCSCVGTSSAGRPTSTGGDFKMIPNSSNSFYGDGNVAVPDANSGGGGAGGVGGIGTTASGNAGGSGLAIVWEYR